MRTLLLLFSLMLVITLNVFSQEKGKKEDKFNDEYQKEFHEDLQSYQNEFDIFIDTINAEYLNFIIKAENEFAELLQESFKGFSVMQPDSIHDNAKPIKISRYRTAIQENISVTLNEKEIALIENKKVGLSTKNIDPDNVESLDKISFQFFQRTISIDFDQELSHLPERRNIDPESIRFYYDFLRKTNYTIVLEQFIKVGEELNLNDWDYYCLINEFSKFLNNDSNIQKIIAWFLLLESNFKVKLGYYNNSAQILFASAHTIYNIPWFKINNERYYAINYGCDSINTYDIEYFKGYKYLTIFHDKPLLLNELKEDKTIFFPYKDQNYSVRLSFDQQYVNYYSTYPLIPLEYYFALPVSLTFKESIENNIAPYLLDKSLYESLWFLLSLVQHGFDYKTDIEQFNHEKYMVPEEMLYYGYSDCDDRSIFFSWLVRILLDKEVVALDFNGHLCSAVEVTDPSVKGNFMHNGKEYIVCDPTYIGAMPGFVLPPFQIRNAVIIDFNKFLNHYNFRKAIWNNINKKGLLQAENTGNISISKDRSIFITGIIINDTPTGAGKEKTKERNSNTFIARLNPIEEIIWLKQLEGSSPNYGYCISKFSEKFVYVFGYFMDTILIDNLKLSAQTGGNFYLAKLDFNGKAEWLQSINIPTDSLSQGLTVVIDSAGSIRYYMPNDHFPHTSNYLMEVDDQGYCYIYATLPGYTYGMELSKDYADGVDFDIVSYLINGTNNLLKENYPKSLSLLYTLIQFLNNSGSVIEGSSLLKAMAKIYSNVISDFPGQYSEVGKISEISNSDGITWIKTIDQQPVTINQFRAHHESRLKLSYVNGNAKINVLSGIKIGGNQIWNDVNYILLDKTTGEIIYDFDNQYKKKMPVHSQLL